MAVTMSVYHPRVTCRGELNYPESCDNISGDMPADTGHKVFGPVGMPSVQEVLPQAIVSGEATLSGQQQKTADLIFLLPTKGDDKCVLKLFSATGRPDLTAWYRIWEAVEAVLAVCVRSHKGGSFMGLGKTSHHRCLIIPV